MGTFPSPRFAALTVSGAATVGTTLAVTGAATFSNTVSFTGASLNLTYAGNASLEIGRVDGTASTPFIDFHSGATAVDYDSRIAATGGTGTIGAGGINVTANGGVNFSGGVSVGTSLSVTTTSSFTGLVTLGSAATTANHAVRKQQIDSLPGKPNVVVATTTDLGSATNTTNTITGKAASVVVNGTLTSGSASVTNVTNASNALTVGASVTGSGIPASTTVVAISGTTITLSSNATASGTVTLTFTQAIVALSVDGVAPALNARILVKNESIATRNGIYTVTTLGTTSVSWVLTRSQDCDDAFDIPGADVSVDSGTINTGTAWTCSTPTTGLVIGTTNITWIRNVLYSDLATLSPIASPVFTGTVTIPFASIGSANVTASLEIGRMDGTASSPFLDFHSGASLVDYDARIIVTGGNGTVGGGTFNYTAINHNFTGPIAVSDTITTTSPGDANISLETTAAPTTAFRKKSIISSNNIVGGNSWLFRATRPSDGAVQDMTLNGGTGPSSFEILTGFNYFNYSHVRLLESFGPCGNGNQTQDHAAWIAAQTYACTYPMILVLTPGKEYILDFAFTVFSLTTNTPTNAFKLEGTGARIRVRNSGAGIVYSGSWFTNRDKMEYFEVNGATFIPEGLNTQTAITAAFKYIPSSTKTPLRITNVKGLLDNASNINVYWTSFLQINNAWGSTIEGVTCAQPIGNFQGTFINLDGACIGNRLQGIYGNYWNTGIKVGYASLVGLKGTYASGTFLPGELVVGSVSGCRGYVAGIDTLSRQGTTFQMTISERGTTGSTNGDFSQSGETLTGQISGAKFTLASSGTASIYKNSEAIYCLNGELVDVFTGFNFAGGTVGDTSWDVQIGHQITNWHVNCRAAAILGQHCDQVMVNSMLIYQIPNGNNSWYGFNLINCNAWMISSNVIIIGGGSQYATGIIMTQTCVINVINSFQYSCNVGIYLDNSINLNQFGLSFFNCTTDINPNASPKQPTANGNSWWRTTSLQANYVGGYQK